MKKTLSSVIAATMLLSPLASHAMADVPKYCPDVNLVKQARFDRAQVDNYMGWIATAPNNDFHTAYHWSMASMVGGGPNEMSEGEAVARANSFLPLVQVGNDSPESDSSGYWCFYVDDMHDPHAMVYVVTPAIEGLGQRLQRWNKRVRG